MKKNIKTFIKDIIPVIVGILIAMYINNWNENRKDKKYINQMLLSINNELNETNKDISTTLIKQKTFIDTLDFYYENEKISLLDIVKKANGIYMPSIKINSWKAISNSKIELLEYDKISALSNIEDLKDILNMKIEKFGNFLYSNTKITETDEKEILKLLMLDIMGTEKVIQERIENISKD